MVEKNNATLDPALIRIRDSILQQERSEKGAAAMWKLRGELYKRRCVEPKQLVENVSCALNTYADKRGVTRPCNVKWGIWRSTYNDDVDGDTDLDIVVAFELSAHFPHGAWRHQHSLPRIDREFGGFADDTYGLGETVTAWGKTIIDRIADATCLVPATVPTELLSWLSRNCSKDFHLTELDPEPRPHFGFPSDAHYYPYFATRCLSFESEDDAVLFRLMWM